MFCTTQHLPAAALKRCRLSAALKRCRLSAKTIAVGDGFAAALFGAFSQTFLKARPTGARPALIASAHPPLPLPPCQMVAEVGEVTISQDGEKAGEAWTSWVRLPTHTHA